MQRDLVQLASDRRSGRGIPSRLVGLAIVAIIVLPGVIFAMLLLSRFADSERSRFEQEAREVARTATSVLDLQIQGWQTTLQTLATSANLLSGNLEAFYNQAAAVKQFIHADIGLRTIDGRPIFNTRAPFGETLPQTRIETEGAAIESRKPFVSDVFIGGIANRPLIATVMPVYVGDQPRYLLHISAETEVVREVLLEAVPGGWLIGVADRSGHYVTRSQDHAAFTGKPGVPEFLAKASGESGTFASKSIDGDDVLVGYAKSDLSGWLVAASVKQSALERPLQTALTSLAAFGVATLIISSLIALWLWRMIDRPLAALTRTSARIGQLDGPMPVRTKLREFIALGEALSSASDQIKAHAAALEARVDARTRELEAANSSLTGEIEQRARVEALLTQAQKMEAIGNLTGGVAHDFNNLLQVIGGNLQLLGREISGNASAERRVENAMAGVARGSHLAAQLLAFGRRQPLQPKVVNIGRLIRGMDDLLRRSLGEAVEIETIIAGGLWNTLVDPANVENAILNLAINARDAMMGEGRLTIEAGNAFLDDAYANTHADVAAGQYVQISVSDTGAGMSREVMEKVFDPFFTTKSEGKGTGLGLSMVYGFVKQSGGHVKIYSELGQGTSLKLYLPRSTEAEDFAVESDTGPVIGGDETILVVEDDEAVRETVIGLLGELGYRVLRAADAQRALTVIESGVAIDLLFTDVVMPGTLRSPELARKAKERLPHLSVLFTSGYTDNAIVHGGRLDQGVNLLSKPYSREQLARKIRHVLSLDGKLPASEPAAQPEPKAGLTVLVCEDDAIIRIDTADMVRELGYTVLEAETGRAALDLVTSQDVDILLTDIGLSDISGTDLAGHARAAKADLAVIFATGRDTVEGFDGVERVALLKKPYRFEQLEHLLGTILREDVQAR